MWMARWLEIHVDQVRLGARALGADLLNLSWVHSLGAPVAAIGRASIFDGISLVGILAVLIAGLGGQSAKKRV